MAKPTYDICYKIKDGPWRTIGGAWPTDKGFWIKFETQPPWEYSEEKGLTLSVNMFKRDEKEDTAPVEKAVDDSDLPF